MQDYMKLSIWSKGIEITKLIYVLRQELPKNEEYGLSSQLKRAAVSIPSNIAEGASRKSKKDFARFLEIALGSAFEIETQLILVKELSLVHSNKVESVLKNIKEERKMLFAFTKKLTT